MTSSNGLGNFFPHNSENEPQKRSFFTRNSTRKLYCDIPPTTIITQLQPSHHHTITYHSDDSMQRFPLCLNVVVGDASSNFWYILYWKIIVIYCCRSGQVHLAESWSRCCCTPFVANRCGSFLIFFIWTWYWYRSLLLIQHLLDFFWAATIFWNGNNFWEREHSD